MYKAGPWASKTSRKNFKIHSQKQSGQFNKCLMIFRVVCVSHFARVAKTKLTIQGPVLKKLLFYEEKKNISKQF